MLKSRAFSDGIYVTQPLLPDLAEFQDKLAEIWASKRLTNMGDQHELLEEQLKERLSVPYLVLFNNGTSALLAALQALDLTGEVITTPFTFAATPHALALRQIKPVFCDIDEQTLTLDPEQIEQLITPRTTAILGVHVYGTPCDVIRIQEIADRHGLKVIYDGAHAFQSAINGQAIGNFGDVTMFSFHATKLFHTVEGGALAFRDPALLSRIKQLRNFGIVHEELVAEVGFNGKLNEIQAAMGLLVLDKLDLERERRAYIRKLYEEFLKNVPGITIVENIGASMLSQQYFVIRIHPDEFGASRDDVYCVLKDHNVHARKYFYPLCSNFPCYAHLPSAAPQRLPVANKVAEQVLSLPFYGDLRVDQVSEICEIIIRSGRDCGAT